MSYKSAREFYVVLLSAEFYLGTSSMFRLFDLVGIFYVRLHFDP